MISKSFIACSKLRSAIQTMPLVHIYTSIPVTSQNETPLDVGDNVCYSLKKSLQLVSKDSHWWCERRTCNDDFTTGKCLFFYIHLTVASCDVLRNFINKNMKHVQKLGGGVSDTLHQFFKWQQKQAGSNQKCIHLHQVTVVFHHIQNRSKGKTAIKNSQ